MKSILGYSLLFLLTYGYFLAAYSPAAHIAYQANKRLPHFTMSGVAGTLSNGYAHHIRIGRLSLGKGQWDWQGLKLFQGQVDYRVALTAMDTRDAIAGHAGRTFTHFYLTDWQGQWRLAPLIQAWGLPWPVESRLELTALNAQWDLNGQPTAVDGTFYLRELQLTAQPPVVLGDFKVDVKQEDIAVRAVITDQGGALELRGELTLIDGQYHFVAIAQVRDAQQVFLQQALSAIARYDNGQWRIDMKGSWPQWGTAL